MTREEILEQISVNLADAIQYCQHHEVGMGVLRELGTNDLDTPGVEIFLASMPTTPTRVLDQLIQRGNHEVTRLLSQNPALHPKLSEHPDPAVRQQVAENRRIAPAIAQQLARDEAVGVRVALAKNPTILANVQRVLLADPVPFVRLALLDNRRLEPEFMDGLSDDLNPTVHACTLLAPKLSPVFMKSWAEYDEELGQLALAHRDDLPPAIVNLLSQSKYPSVQLALLRQPSLPEEFLAAHVASEDPSVLRIIANRRNLSAELQRALIANPAFPLELKRTMAQRADLADEVGSNLCDTGDSELLRDLAVNLAPQLSATRMRLTQCGFPFVLKLLLANPLAHTPEVLSSLVLHATEDVLSHLAYRSISCESLLPEAQERLRNSILPSVRELAAV
ncbi:MAG: hypothetical protein II943_04450 [Victivallales bacterium]|nr:hypothetical protein [Victivallales bacterium]